ncbi:MAG: sugar ABC transporter substrate-binding protein [Candidatus Sericytochromatia bacterium]|nr:sugar ABC transporter substrate-binding protein [Candidatus Sericytochromatia bacterium]
MPLTKATLKQAKPWCLAALLALTLSGCAARADQEITLASWGSVEEIGLLKPLLAQFNREHPKTPVRLLHIPDGYFQKLHLLYAAGQGPDVAFMNNWQLPTYAAGGELQDLAPFISRSQALKADEFVPASLNACRYKGNLYAIPRDVSNLVVYINEEQFKAAGVPLPNPNWTLDEMLAMGKAFVKDENNDGELDHWAISADPRPLFWLPFVWSYGGDLLSADLKQFTLDQPAARQGLQAFADLRGKYHLSPRETETGGAAMGQLFAQSKLAMFVSGRWSVPAFREKLTFKWDIRPFPKGPAGSIVDADASGWAISKSSHNPQAAWTLIEWLAGKTAATAFTAGGLVIPARRDVGQSDTFLQPGLAPASAHVFLDALQTGRPLRTPPAWGELNGEIEQALGPVWQGRAPLQAGLASLRHRVEPLL